MKPEQPFDNDLSAIDTAIRRYHRPPGFAPKPGKPPPIKKGGRMI